MKVIPRFCLIGALLIATVASRRGVCDDAAPNFVIILADDMGYGDAGCYGGTAFPTPAIDRLAAEGLRFTDFHSNGTVCSPTRAALLTGRYQQRAGIGGVVYADPKRNRHHGLHTVETTFAELLKTRGYKTAVFGKWHLGYERKYNPVRHGFDEFRGYVSGNVDFVAHIDGQGFFDWWRGAELDRDDQGYVTRLITRYTVDFISRSKDQPFCVYVAHQAPHFPYQGPNDPPVRREGQPGQVGSLWNDREPEHMRSAYVEMMAELDRSVGEITASLDRFDLSRRTFVFFFSDNGAAGPGSCAPLRGRKGSLWEGGHRVPAIARWTGKIQAGAVTGATAVGIDLMPTLLELVGIEAPTTRPLDGVSLVPVLLRRESLPPRQLFWHYRSTAAVREGVWKLLVDEKKNAARLYRLDQDLAEKHDLAASYPERVRTMGASLAAWRRRVTDGATEQPRANAKR